MINEEMAEELKLMAFVVARAQRRKEDKTKSYENDPLLTTVWDKLASIKAAFDIDKSDIYQLAESTREAILIEQGLYKSFGFRINEIKRALRLSEKIRRKVLKNYYLKHGVKHSA